MRFYARLRAWDVGEDQVEDVALVLGAFVVRADQCKPLGRGLLLYFCVASPRVPLGLLE